jgi:hypothetical protein
MLALIVFACLEAFTLSADGAQAVPPTSVPFAALQSEYAAVGSANDLYSRALHLYLLNDTADQYAYSLNQESRRNEAYQLDWHTMKRDTAASVQRANKYGAAIDWCEYGADWTAETKGYEAYLSLWPEGPYAEEAWWRGRLLQKLNRCFDAEGSEEETAGFVHDYAEFLTHFPHGKHEAEAGALLKGYQSELEDYKQQKNGSGSSRSAPPR